MVEVQLRSGTKAVQARLASAGYLQQHGFAIKEGDALRLHGYWVPGPEGYLLIVMEAGKDGRTLVLRNDSGRLVSGGN
jgi:hypothetical protein